MREVSDDYWAPVGVWQIRESVRNAFDGAYAEAGALGDAVAAIVPELLVSMADLRRKSRLVSGLQARRQDFVDP